MTLALFALAAIACMIADHITGTAWYQKGNNTMTPDHFDIFPADDSALSDDGSTADYWTAYLAALPAGLVEDSNGIAFSILTDDELAAIDSEVDSWPESDVPDDDLLWFYSAGESEEYDDDDADYRPDYIGGY